MSGYLVAQWGFDWTPTKTVPRAAVLGSAAGIWYPAVWIVTLDVLRELLGGGVSQSVSAGGGLPAVATGAGFGVAVLFGTWVAAKRNTPSSGWRPLAAGTFAVTFGVVVPIVFVSALPVLFPSLSP